MHRSPRLGIAIAIIALVLFGLVAAYPIILNSASAAEDLQKAQPAVAQAELPAVPAGHMEHHAAGAAMSEAEPTATTESISDTVSAAEHAAHHPDASLAVTATTPSTVTGIVGSVPGVMDADMAGMHASMSSMMSGMLSMMEEMMQEGMPSAMHPAMTAMHDDMLQMQGVMMGQQPMELAAMQGMMAGMVAMNQGSDGASAMPAHDMAGMEDDVGGAAGGHDIGPVSSAGVPVATQTAGGQPLAYREEEGVKVFELTAKPVLWPILQGVTVTAWTYNGVLCQGR